MPPKRALLAYAHADLLLALEDMKKGETASAVSKKYNIPRSTLIYKSTGKTPIDRKMGPAPRLGTDSEKMLVNWVMAMAARGFPVTKTDLLISVHQISKDMNMTHLFPNGRPGNKWLSLFLKRHPEVSDRTVEKLSHVRASVSEDMIRNWHAEVTSYLKEQGSLQVLEDPKRVFNTDESAFFLCPKGEKVLGIRGQKNVYEIHTGSDKENLTVLVNANAANTVAPTLVVYPGQRLPSAIKLTFPKDWAIGRSDSGWINGEVFFEYFANNFYRWLKDQKVVFPIIMFLDGHKSHMTYYLSKFCSDHNIILISLPPNCTHILQPLDVALFKPLKSGWLKAVHQWRMTNEGEKLSKYNFAPMLEKVLEDCTRGSTLENGFKRCGLCPWNVDAVDYSKVDTYNCTVSKAMKKQVSSISDDVRQSQDTHIEGASCLTFMEQFIDPQTLGTFQETYGKITPIWEENDPGHDLFVCWKKMKDHVLAKTENLTRSKPQVSTTNEKNYESEDSDLVDTPADSVPELPNLAPDLQEVVAQASCPSSEKASTSTTSNKEKLSKVLSPGTGGANVPSPFKNNLFWPGTPTKTKKRAKNYVKLPAVVSGSDWQKYEEKRMEKKKQEEQEKAERKRVREEKKRDGKPQNKKRKIVKKKLIFDEDEDWTCHVCGKRYSSELITSKRRRWIECDKCQHTYHYRCIPKKHLNLFGIDEDDEDDDELAFICHLCTPEMNSDNDPLELSELSEDEEDD
jgi:hypothetical protein